MDAAMDEKNCGIYSRGTFTNIFVLPAAFIRGRPQIGGGV